MNAETGQETTEPVLDERKAAILHTVVTEYIDSAQPVGSSHVARAAGLRVSSATVRNDMASLEDDGFLVQPHTSAGRVPTDKGYRYFVDHLPAAATLVPGELEQVHSFFARTHGELEQMLHDTSQMLSALTQYAAVVVGPVHESASVRAVQLVRMGPRSVLIVLVLSDGSVEKHVFEPAEDVDEASVDSASKHLAGSLVGRKAKDPLPAAQPGNEAVERLIYSALSVLSSPARSADSEHIFVGGTSRMAQAFDAIETVRSVLSILEQQYMVVSLVKNVLDNNELSVAIGAEHGLPSLAECSVVVAPFLVAGQEVGAIGVLGPTRMHYEQAMAAVAVVGEQLGSRLSEG